MIEERTLGVKVPVWVQGSKPEWCPRVEKKIYKEIVHYKTYMATPQ